MPKFAVQVVVAGKYAAKVIVEADDAQDAQRVGSKLVENEATIACRPHDQRIERSAVLVDDDTVLTPAFPQTDGEADNRVRALRIDLLVGTYLGIENHDFHLASDRSKALMDILADIRHWCQLNDIDLTQCLRTSALHHAAEQPYIES